MLGGKLVVQIFNKTVRFVSILSVVYSKTKHSNIIAEELEAMRTTIATVTSDGIVSIQVN